MTIPCYTRVRVEVSDTALNRKARKNLGLPVEGSLAQRDADRVTREVRVLKAIHETRRLAPNAVVRRRGDELTIQVEV